MGDVCEGEYQRCCIFLSIRIQTDPLWCPLLEVTIVEELIPDNFCDDFGRVHKSRVCTNEIIVPDRRVLQGESH